MHRRIERRIVIRSLLGVSAALVAAAAACGGGGPTEPGSEPAIARFTAGVAQTAAAVTGQQAKIADEVQKGHFVGFDTHTYPGTMTMKAWKDTPGSPYKWVGYYLPSPCHADKSWSGKRDTLVNMGWGLAAVYVGQQTWGHTPRALSLENLKSLRDKTPCAADLISGSEGEMEADDAVRKATAEGFPAGAVIFLDIERMETVPDAMREYYRSWTRRMLQNGKYLPGIYTHQHNAQQVFDDVSAEFQAAGRTEMPRFWIAGGKGFDPGRAPQDVGYAFAGVWQGVIDVARSVATIKLPVDINVAKWASPSESGVNVQ
jgi:hypothetical protein